MKIILPLISTDENAVISVPFGHARALMIYDSEQKTKNVFENSFQGISLISYIIEEKIDAVVCLHINKKAFMMLEAENVKVYDAMREDVVDNILENFENLEPITMENIHNYQGHH